LATGQYEMNTWIRLYIGEISFVELILNSSESFVDCRSRTYVLLVFSIDGTDYWLRIEFLVL